MSIAPIGPYSPDTVYGEFTSPFTWKRVSINSHTPYDKAQPAESEVTKREDFKKTLAKLNYKNPIEETYKEVTNPKKNIEKQADNLTNNNITTNNNDDIYTKDKKNNTNINITHFSSSEMKSEKNSILRNSIDKPYTKDTITIKHANDAYKKSAYLTNNPVGVLSTCSYEVV